MRFSAPHLPFFARVCRALAVAALTLPAMGALWQLDGPQSTAEAAGPVAERQWNLFMVTFWVTLFLFIVVGAVLAYATWKFRAKSKADEQAAPPPQGHGNPFVELGLTVGSILCLVIIAVPTMSAIWYTDEVPGGDTPAKLEAMIKNGDAYEVTATGYQWWFKFEYPNEKLAGGVLTTANELVIPAGKPVHINLRTMDVIHSFWVPKLAGKVDMIPNRANRLWLEAKEPGYYYGQCAEYCGESHAIMRFRVIALKPEDFTAWLANQKLPSRAVTTMAPASPAGQTPVIMAQLDLKGRPALEALSGMNKLDPTKAFGFPDWQAKQVATPAQEDTALIASGMRLFQEKTCIVCHTIRGLQNAIGINGPDLTHVGARSTIAAGVLENTPDRMRDWITDPSHWKPGNKMFHGVGAMPGYMRKDDAGTEVRNISLTTEQIKALTAYLQSLK